MGGSSGGSFLLACTEDLGGDDRVPMLDKTDFGGVTNEGVAAGGAVGAWLRRMRLR